ncbi:MAG: alpha/beta hydrolase [Caldilineaceae bacterium]|nr:alpha/beta hydrolase [Caldilineaceae bacterium]MCB0124868.1 alpha/beta hydrolase [Caldilineaceae bacterium]
MTNVEMEFASLNGTDFYYEGAGSGSPLVLIHAGICDSRMWDEQFAHFAESHRVFRYDMRGYGQTEPVDVPYAHHEDLRALLDHWEIEQAHLVGCSMGGSTALDFALAYPDRVRSLTIVCAEPGGYEDVDEQGEPIEEEIPEQWDQIVEAFRLGAYESVAEWEVRFWVVGPERTPDQVDPAVRHKVYEMNVIALRNEAQELGENQPLDPPAAERLGELTCPTQIIIGALDQPVMRRAADLMANTIAGAQKVVIPETAHLPSMEQPRQFNQILSTFLAGL